MSGHTPLDTPGLRSALATIERMDRRSFLKFSAAASLLGSIGALPATHAAETAITLKSIDAAETAVFAKIAEVVLPVTGTPLAPWKPEVLLGTLDQALLGTMEPQVLAGLKDGIAYFNDGPKKNTARLSSS
ncbi:MAG: twin-arginine translocation signal domain-containing protein [Thiolinea sp.]